MIVGIEGKLFHNARNYLDIKSYGLVYRIFVSLNCSANLNSDSIENVFLHTTHIIKEDSQTLYGFLDRDEKNIFNELIKVNGVGPKVALAICSTFTPNEFASVIDNKDINMLKKVPGIGPKSANRLLIELASISFNIQQQESNKNLKYYNEATLALESLGFKSESIKIALKDIEFSNTSQIVKDALKKLQK